MFAQEVDTLIDKLVQMGESRQPSNVRRNILAFEEVSRRNRIDRTETSFAGKSKMKMKDLKEAAKRRREIAEEF